MSFQEPQDPLINALQDLIDDMKSSANRQEFKEVLDKIYNMFPFVDVTEFLEQYVYGEYSKELIRKFNLSGYLEYNKLLQLLKIGKKRRSKQKGDRAKEINLSDVKLAKRYRYLTEALGGFRHHIDDMMAKSALRMIMTLQLYRNEDRLMTKEDLVTSVSGAIKDFKHLVPTHCASLLPADSKKLEQMIVHVLHDMDNESLLETDSLDKIRLEKHQLRIQDYLLNTIRRIEGITHEKLAVTIKEKLAAMSHMPHSMILIALDELATGYKIVRKEGYWKLRPYYDEYFTFDGYRKIGSEAEYYAKKGRKFFGRTITPDEFIDEIIDLERGDFEDQDDQVTRIAGMILSNSNMMAHPPNELLRFDFAVDLSNYEFTKQQMKVIEKLDIDIRSNIVYVRVMINDRLTKQDLEIMISDIKERGRDEQGFVISFIPPDIQTREILRNDKTIQLISKKELREWCKITHTIPARRGAVAVVRQGDHMGSIVRIESVNYESGRADITRFPDMTWSTQYIGSLEEITLRVGTNQFAEISSKYFGFLGKLRQISKVEKFRSIVANGLAVSSDPVVNPDVVVSREKIECDFDKSYRVEIDLTEDVRVRSLEYSIDGLFSCTCFGWTQKSRTEGLCDHLIYTINEAVKEILSDDGPIPQRYVEYTLAKIEIMMDTFLDRLRYSSTGRSSVVICPNCDEVARTLDEVKDMFGYRQMGKGDQFSLRRQSWCRKCR